MIKFDDIITMANNRGFKLISTEYKDITSPLLFECSKGHKMVRPINKLVGCKECKLKILNNVFDFNIIDTDITSEKEI